jgi:hypothetical protein
MTMNEMSFLMPSTRERVVGFISTSEWAAIVDIVDPDVPSLPGGRLQRSGNDEDPAL